MRNLIPRFIHDNFKSGNFAGQFEAVSMFVDISGFTAMTEALMTHGNEGAEALATALMSVFDPLVEAIYSHDGFITAFAGDGFTAVFPVHPELPAAARNACSAAQIIQRRFSQNPSRTTPFGQFDFAIKIGIGLGEVIWAILRADGQINRHSYFFRGAAIDRCARAEHLAKKGEWIITADIYEALSDSLIAEPSAEAHFRVFDFPKPNSAKSIPEWHANADSVSAFFPPELVNAQNQGEFRQVVTAFIAFTDLTDDASIRSLMQAIFRLTAKYRGTLTRLDFGDKGCNLLMFWGAPMGYENDVERALSFALELKTVVALKAGITRRVMYAGYAGSAIQGDYTCYGQGINLAARMMTNAAWDEVWLDESVARQAGLQFETEWVGRRTFKGIAKEFRIFRLMGRAAAGQSLFYLGRMVGREEEMQHLRDFSEPIFAAEPRFAGLIYIYGEAGMGKSRLIYEFQQELLRSHDCHWLFCPADEILRQSLHPFKHMLKEYFRQSAAFSPDENKARFEAQFTALLDKLTILADSAALCAELIRTRSLLAALLDVHYPDDLYDRLEPRLRFENTLGALRDFILALCRVKPVVLFLEDIHWYDLDSYKLMNRLSYQLHAEPLGFVAASRYGDDNNPITFALNPVMPTAAIDLKYLTESGIQDLAQQALNGILDSEGLQILVTKTQGNPFFVEQLSLYLKEQGFLQNTAADGEPARYQAGLLSTQQVPTQISGVLIARLDRLPLPVKQVVQTAAVLGWQFEVKVLEYMVAHDPDLAPKLQQAARAAIWTATSDVQYIFKHALMRDAAYDMQLRARLMTLHGLAAAAIEAVFADDLSGHWAELAHHSDEAGDNANAIIYLEKAGDIAAENYQNETAVQHYDRLLAKISCQLEATPSEALVRQKQAVSIYLKKSAVLFVIGDWAGCGLALQQALALADALNDLALRLESYIHQAQLDERTGQFDSALAWAEKIVTLASPAPEHQVYVQMTYSVIAEVYSRRREFDKALAYYEQALTFCQQIKVSHRLPECFLNLGRVYTELRKFDLAEHCFQQAQSLLALHPNPIIWRTTLKALGNLFSYKAQYERALQFYQQYLAEGRKVGDKWAISAALGNTGVVYLYLGVEDRAIDYLQQDLKMKEEMGDQHSIALLCFNIARCYALKDDYPAMRPWLERSLAVADVLKMTFMESRYLCVRTLLKLKCDAEAAELLAQARLAIKESNNTADHISCEILTALLEAGQGDPVSAIVRLTTLAKQTEDDASKAEIAIELWRLTGAGSYKDEATLFYKKRYAETLDFAYKKILKELNA